MTARRGKGDEVLHDTTNPFILKLRRYGRISDDDERYLTAMMSEPRHYAAKADVVSQGGGPGRTRVVMSGFLARYKMLPEGSRQIVGYLLPGDPCDLHVSLLDRMDHDIVAITPSTVSTIDDNLMTSDRVQLLRALWLTTLVEQAIHREWLVNIGRRGAIQRLAHLICELYLRFRDADMVGDHHFTLVLTQQELADTLGLSLVHVNRSLQHMRADEMIRTQGRTLTLLKPQDLANLAGFNPDYLHRHGANYELSCLN